MRPIIRKTFGGLAARYYVRHFLFGLIFPALFLFALRHDAQNLQLPPENIYFGYFLFAANTLLYPYSRFVYESIVDYIMGENVFFVSGCLMLPVKFVTMAICWSWAIFIAPIGLLYLYIHHSRADRSTD
jgi:hypothetical protein